MRIVTPPQHVAPAVEARTFRRGPTKAEAATRAGLQSRRQRGIARQGIPHLLLCHTHWLRPVIFVGPSQRTLLKSAERASRPARPSVVSMSAASAAQAPARPGIDLQVSIPETSGAVWSGLD